MFRLIIMYLIFSSLLGFGGEGRRTVRNLFDFILLFYVVGFLFRVGINLLPMIIVIFVMARIVVPFLRGFFSRF